MIGRFVTGSFCDGLFRSGTFCICNVMPAKLVFNSTRSSCYTTVRTRFQTPHAMQESSAKNVQYKNGQKKRKGKQDNEEK